MKKFYKKNFIFLIILLLLSLKNVLNNGCIYKKDILDKPPYSNTNDLNDDYLSGIQDDREALQKCYSLSKTDVQSELCCYHWRKRKCITISNKDIDTTCPEATTIVHNNCGMAGIYEPETSSICTEIPLVHGYCCFVKTKSGNTACVRTKELNKDKNSLTTQIDNHVKICSNNTTSVDTVICIGTYLKDYWQLFVLFLIIYF